MGNLGMSGRNPLFIQCAPKGCIELLLEHGVEIIGKRAVVIGRSKIVGLLATSLLLLRHQTAISMVHAFMKNPEQITSEADIVIADVGIPNMFCGCWLKLGAVLIGLEQCLVEDQSLSYTLDPNSQGFHIIGDVCYGEIGVASAISPVPGDSGGERNSKYLEEKSAQL
ncbi:hypothetical protein L6164_023289 [Bauhinia variegata]|uniref:Uncharacterized protein n=1 Tax=Bauhinia variegata TaxID=167791 RepID=A0ACB9MJN2_BAUVA|nr:hypothetical protein L6164_023289 [Bauhinia variegata]